MEVRQQESFSESTTTDSCRILSGSRCFPRGIYRTYVTGSETRNLYSKWFGDYRPCQWSRYCGGPCPTSPSSSRSIQGYRLGPPPRGIRRRPHYRFELVNVSPLEPWSICLVSMVRGVCFRENRSLGDDVGKDENIEEQRL